MALIGPAGSFYPLEWLSRVLAIRGTSSGEDESMSWGIAVRMGLRMAAIIEDLRVTSLGLRGFVDNASLRLALCLSLLICLCRPLCVSCVVSFFSGLFFFYVCSFCLLLFLSFFFSFLLYCVCRSSVLFVVLIAFFLFLLVFSLSFCSFFIIDVSVFRSSFPASFLMFCLSCCRSFCVYVCI